MNRVQLLVGVVFDAPPQGRIVFTPGVYRIDEQYLTQEFVEGLLAEGKCCDADTPVDPAALVDTPVDPEPDPETIADTQNVDSPTEVDVQQSPPIAAE